MKRQVPLKALSLAAVILAGLIVWGVTGAGGTAETSQMNPTLTEATAMAQTVNSVFPSHEPYGTGIGVMPGRVVWTYDPNSVDWDGEGYWWELDHFNEAAIQQMVEQGIASLAGARDPVSGWTALFTEHNRTHGSSGGYQAGQKIAVKVNMNGAGAYSDDQHGQTHESYTNPVVLRALLVSLVEDAGVSAEDITVYDAGRVIPDYVRELCSKAPLEGVQFRYRDIAGSNDARPDEDAPVIWSQEVSGEANYLPDCVTQADYLINLANLKGHVYGITLTAKNHFGSILNSDRMRAPQAAGLHRYLTQNRMGSYTVLVDLMANYQLGKKTMLYLLDAVICAPGESVSVTAENSRWQQAPFHGDYASSIFFSQDPVAIDSVGADFLMNEPAVTSRNSALQGNPNVENYLHEAGLVAAAPSGTVYYDGNGVRVTNLGVHEHWNNPTDKQYSRNLRSGEGIELVRVGAGFDGEETSPQLEGAADFTDVPPGAWYAPAVEYCRENGLMSGTSSNTFSPDAMTSRAMLVAILYRQAGNPEAGMHPRFSDVPAEAWYENALAWAVEAGVIGGYADGRFGPNDPVTREQFVTILWRYTGSPAGTQTDSFSDGKVISAYAAEAVQWAAGKGIISGRSDGRFAPHSGVTRAEAAVMLYRYLSRQEDEAPAESGSTEETAPAVFMTTNLTADGLMAVYEALDAAPSGRIAVKLSTGEPGSITSEPI